MVTRVQRGIGMKTPSCWYGLLDGYGMQFNKDTSTAPALSHGEIHSTLSLSQVLTVLQHDVRLRISGVRLFSNFPAISIEPAQRR